MNNRLVAQRFSERKTKATGSNLYIKGDTIYSYGSHFPVARWHWVEGKPIVWFNSDKYSISTTRHQGYVRSELYSKGVKIINTPDCNPDRAIDYLIHECKNAISKATHARKQYMVDYWMTRHKSLLDQIDTYRHIYKYGSIKETDTPWYSKRG
jgi:hypothetical protein